MAVTKEKSIPTKEHTRSEQNDYNRILRDMSTDTQSSKILRYLMEHGSITGAEALNRFNCWRLSARIKDLRDAGVDITTIRVENLGNSGTHAKYILSRR